MERGSSVPWQQTMQDAIGEGRLNGEALREYFRPLEEWLRTENLRTGEVVGWTYGEQKKKKEKKKLIFYSSVIFTHTHDLSNTHTSWSQTKLDIHSLNK